MAARILERHPAIHLLVNNAGMPARGTFLTVDPELVERVIHVNYLGGVWMTRALLPGLRWAGAGEGAHIVNLVSVSGTTAFAPAGAYSASKHAQLAFSRSLAAVLRGSGVSVHAVLPGFVETEGFPQKGVLKSPLMGRFVIQPPRVAEAVVRCRREGEGRDHRPVVPVPPRLDPAGAEPRPASRASRGCPTTERPPDEPPTETQP